MNAERLNKIIDIVSEACDAIDPSEEREAVLCAVCAELISEIRKLKSALYMACDIAEQCDDLSDIGRVEVARLRGGA